MTRKAQVTPGKFTALQAKIGNLVITLFLLFGLVFGFVVLRETPNSEEGLRLLIGAFFFLWVVTCLAIIVLFTRILSKHKNSRENPLVDVYYDVPVDAARKEPGAFEARLRSLEQLKKDGLIAEAEYQGKREQILQEKW